MLESFNTPADPQQEIAALKEALQEKSEEIKRLKVKADKWDALDEKISKFYPEDESEEAGDLGDIGEVAAIAFGFL